MFALVMYLVFLALLGGAAVFSRLGKLPIYWIVVPWLIAFAPIWFGVISYNRPPVTIGVVLFVTAQLLFIALGNS